MNPRPDGFDAALVAARPALVAFATSLCWDVGRAEDLAQHTIVKALDKFELFQQGTNLRAWLFTILRNEFYSLGRKQGREVPDPDDLFAKSIPVPEGQSSSYDLKVIRRRMRMLSTEQRRCIELVAILGYAYEEAAVLLGVPIGTVKSQVSRSRVFLETGEEMEPEVVVEPPAIPVSDRSADDAIAQLYREGSSASEIAAALPGVKRSDVMRVVIERRLPARKS